MKRFFLSLSLLLHLTCLFSQKLNFEFCPGIGFYSMTDLKKNNSNTLNLLPFRAIITDDFPPYIFYKAGIVYQLNTNLSLGFVASFNSTGSRVAVQDYSGEYRFDQKVSAFSPGITMRFRIITHKIVTEGYLNGYYSISRLDIREYMRINLEKSYGDYDFHAKTFQFEPGLNIYYKFNFLRVGIFGGYLAEIPTAFKLKNNSGIHTADTGWKGVRAGLYTSFAFTK